MHMSLLDDEFSPEIQISSSSINCSQKGGGDTGGGRYMTLFASDEPSCKPFVARAMRYKTRLGFQF
jgi:hypothetical protein